MTDSNRPTPEHLLDQLRAEEEKMRRGRLKIFFGSSAGVGKTYSMLSAAQELAKSGMRVIVGIIETHKRPNTEKLLDGLKILPPLTLNYHGVELKELDLDTALTLKPDVILVDELAHTNAIGARHPKRWNDVMELLDAGINVYTTLNVQHIESLSDLVAGSTGIWVKETIPDSVFDMADDIVLVDIDSDDLLKRLKEGNVYIAADANKRAAENFFKKENLNALREIALRRTAQRVDAERDLLHEMDGHQPVTDKILVCIKPDKLAAKLIRSTKRLATALKVSWDVIYVEHSTGSFNSPDGKKEHALGTLERMVDRLDGKMSTVRGTNLVDEILSYARENNITKIIMGKSRASTLIELVRPSLVNALIRASGTIDVMVITDDEPRQSTSNKTSPFQGATPYHYLFSLMMVAGFTIPGLMMPEILTDTDQALLYLTGSVIVAESIGLGPALFYALLAAISFNLFFTSQHAVSPADHRAYLMTFVVMLVTGYVVATQSARLKAQTIAARKKEKQTHSLFELTRTLATRRGRFPVAEVVSDHLSKLHNVNVSVWMTNAENVPAAVLGNIPEETYYKDYGALEWCFKNAKNAGRGTTTMPSAAGFYLPLITTGGTLGVIGVFSQNADRLFSFDEIASMETLSSLLASALDRVRAGEIVAQTAVEKENKKLRECLISVFEKNIRGPSETVSGTVSNILNQDKALDPSNLHHATAALHQQARSLQKDIGLVLKASSLEIGSLELNRIPSSIASLIDHVLTKMAPSATNQIINKIINKIIPQTLPDVLIDTPLIEQAISHILENTFHYSPPGGVITIQADRQESDILVSISDQGLGLPIGFEENIFEKFYSIPTAGAEKSAGLGLAISSGIFRLHGGRLWAETLPEGGARFSFTLPIG